MKSLSVKEIAAAIGGKAVGDAVITNISIDSRTVEKGGLYIAISGENFDGHDFSKSAVENGAAAVMCHKEIDCDCPKIIVDDTQLAFLRFASWYRSLFNIDVVGLTGSVGKTTTKEMISAVLSSEKETLKTEGNLNNSIGVPRTLMRLEQDTQAAVVEMGMDQKGQISELSSCVKPTAAVITNVGVSHIENLGSREGILAAKLEILDGLKEGAPIFLNGDDPYLMSAKIENRPVIYYGLYNSVCKYKAENVKFNGTNTSFDVLYDGKTQYIEIPTIGVHNVYNAVAAFAVGTELGIKSENAAKGLKGYLPSGMRQRIREVSGITFIEDCYNASPDSVRAAITTLSTIKANRRIAVLGDMLELGSISAEAHESAGVLAVKKGIDIVLTYGERSSATAEKAKEMGVEVAENFRTHEELAARLNGILQQGDTVLFKASRAMKLETAIELVYNNLKG